MSAICGMMGRRSATHPNPDLGAMLDALADYGLGRAEWSDGPVHIGRRCRLDAGDGASPKRRASAEPAVSLHRCREAGLALAADVRLDDREALQDTLGCRGAEVSDGELILRAYRRWGRDCPSRLLGDYAFALWDGRRRILFCARDHIGVKPFYYAWTGERFVFASAVPAVLAAPGVSGRLDDDFVAAHLTRIGLNTTMRTFFVAVRKLPPGHALTVTGDGRLRTERYWRPEDSPRARPASDDACAEECLDLCTRAVRDRLRGPGPVGVHLSGGLDSSSVAVLAARELHRQGRAAPLAFTWLPALGGGAPKPEHAPEYALVDAVAGTEGLRTLHCGLSSEDVLAMLRRDGALPGVHVHINEEAVQRRAEALDVRVLLSGLGGDQGVSFSGYRGYPEHLLLTGRWLGLIAHLRSHGGRPFKHLAKVVLGLVHLELPRAVRQWLRRKEPDRRRWLIAPAFRWRAKRFESGMVRRLGTRRMRLRMLRAGSLSGQMEGWAASGAARGIEYRYPLLDRRVLEFALGLPHEQFRHGKLGRWLMRRAFDSVLPAEVCRHSGKADPARVEAMDDAFAEALPMVRRELVACATPPPRARYIDMPHLLECLDADRYRAAPRPSPILNALQFLDF